MRLRRQWLIRPVPAGAARSVWNAAVSGLGLCLMSGCALLERPLSDAYRSPPASVVVAPVQDAVRQRPGYGQPDAAAGRGADIESAAVAGMGQWWKDLGVEEINTLAEQVDAGNIRLRSGVVQVEQQRLQVLIDGAARAPQINASLGMSLRNARDPLKQQRSTVETYTAGVQAQWQADVFNRIGNTVSAGEHRLEATEWEAVALRHTLIAESIQRYVASVFLHRRLALAQQNVQSRQRTADIIDSRYQKGVRRTDAAQVAASREAVLQTQSAMAGLEQAWQQQQHALQVLKGELPGRGGLSGETASPVGAGSRPASLPDVPPARELAAGVPADLLLRRPDVRAAGAQLRAAQYSALAALSSQYPTLGFSGGVSGSGTRLSDALDVKQWVAQLGAELLVRLFDGGRADKVTLQAEKRAEQLALQYVQTVLEAVRDVEDALLAERLVDERVALLQQRLEAANRSEQVQQARFERGTGDYLAFLDSQRSRVNAEDALLQAREDAWRARISLMLALGGSWTEAEQQLFRRRSAGSDADSVQPGDDSEDAKPVQKQQEKRPQSGAASADSGGAAGSVPISESVFGDGMRN